MKKKITLSVIGASALAVALSAGMCVPPGGAPCDGEGDCSTEEHCHPTLKICVPNCAKVDGACDDQTGTTCSESDIGGLYFKGICVCDPEADSCGSGEKCNPYDLTCETPCSGDGDCSDYPDDQNRVCREQGGDDFCLLPADDCRNADVTCEGEQVCDTTGKCVDPCTADSCAEGQYCGSDKVCHEACTADSCGAGKYCDGEDFEGSMECVDNPAACDSDLAGCIGNEELCDPDYDKDTSTYPACVEPDVATNTCDAPGERDASGPIIYDGETEVIAACGDAGDKTIVSAFFFMFDPDGDYTTSPYGDSKVLVNGSWVAAYDADTSVDGDMHLLEIQGCFTRGQSFTRAYMTTDEAGNESNRACLTFQVPSSAP